MLNLTDLLVRDGTVAPSAEASPVIRSAILHTYTSLDELSALRPAWDELLSQYPQATTFSTWEWLSSWWRCFGHGRQMLTLALFDSGSLIGLAPLSITRERTGLFSLRALRLMGDGSGDSDNLDLPARPGFEHIFAGAILNFLKERKDQWDVGLLNTLPPCSPVTESMAELLRSSSWTFFECSSKSSAISLPESWELYTTTLSSEDRKNLTRYTRRLQNRHATRIYRCSTLEELPACLEALFRLHQERWRSAGEPGSFASTERRDFYNHLSRCLLDRGRLEIWVMELDGEIAAVQFAFRHENKVFQLQEGYDHTRASDRLGFVLRGEVLRQLIADKVQTYDFLGGEDPYKTRWGAVEGHYRQLHFAPSFGIGAARLQFIDRSSRSKDWLRQRLPSSVWKLLHKANVAFKR